MRAFAILCFIVGGCDDDTTGPNESVDMTVSTPPDLANGPTAARGEYLVKYLLACGDCHTTPDPLGRPSTNPSDFLAGGRDFPVGPMHVYAKNLTPDNTNGIGSWTLDQIKRAIKNGVDDQMKPLFPIMPYYMFHNLSDNDASSIAMYLKTIPASIHQVPESTATVPMAATAIDDAQVPHTALSASDPGHDAAERGRYLVEVSCIECHTKHLPPGSPTVLDQTRWFGGGEVFPLAPGLTTISANITPDATGLAGFSVSEIEATLKTDQERGSGRQLCPPMIGGPGRLGGLTDGDLSDIAAYVHSLPPVSAGPYGCTDGGMPYGIPDGG
jgi:mono/diheme cytochrome c family protein